MEYSAGMVSYLFWLSETRKTAELLINGKDKNEIKELAIKENIYQARSEDRKRRIFGVAIKRLETLPDSLVEQIAYGDIGTVKLLVLISIMKTDRLFFEFVYNVHRQAIILGENKITDRAINTFFDDKKAQSQVVAGWSESAINKLKQCCTKMLFEAGVLKSATGDRNIIIPSVDYKLRWLLEENNLKIYLNAITGEE
ncbi:MAG: DUF1819 family protein [Bacillota bacterium]